MRLRPLLALLLALAVAAPGLFFVAPVSLAQESAA